ncbi:MAG: anti-sigma factor antagonist [Gaiellaceae bacterium]
MGVLLQVEDRELDGAHLLELAGEGDLSNASEFSERLLALSAPGDRKIALDLRGLRFMDSTMVHAILGATARIRRHDGEMVIVCADTGVCRILEHTAVDTVFQVVPTLEQALAELRVA